MRYAHAILIDIRLQTSARLDRPIAERSSWDADPPVTRARSRVRVIARRRRFSEPVNSRAHACARACALIVATKLERLTAR